MLTSKSYPTPHGPPRVLITDTEQCEICHRTADKCQLNPWPNHEFIPRTWRADQLPAHLRARAAEPEPPSNVIPLRQEGLPL